MYAKQLGTWKAYSVIGAATIAPGTYYSQVFPTPSLVKSTESAYVQTCKSGGLCYSSTTVTVGA